MHILLASVVSKGRSQHYCISWFAFLLFGTLILELGGDDETNGKVKMGYVRPDGTELGNEGTLRATSYTKIPEYFIL